MGCAFDSGGGCTVGVLNLFGCPENCPKFVDASCMNVTVEVSDQDKQLINLCKKIRQFSAMRRLKVDTSQHHDSDNLHLKKFIECCGKSFSEFVVEYLTNLQPFQLVIDKSQSFDKSVRCIIDTSYGRALYLKVQFTATDGLVISYHENQIKKHKVYNSLQSNLSYAFTKTDVPPGGIRILPVIISRGISTFSLELTCRVVDEDLVQISISDVDRVCTEYVNSKINAILHESINTFSSMKEISITSYGESLLNDISALIDGICYSHLSSENKGMMMLALNQKMRELIQLPDSKTFLEALDERYSSKLGSGVEKSRALLGLEEE